MKKLTNFNQFLTEGKQPHLLVYRGASYPFNYTVIKGDELYFVSFRSGKPFLFKYKGKINREQYNPNAPLIKNPSMGLIVNIQNKCIPPSKTNEEFDSTTEPYDLERGSFIKKLKERVEEFLKSYPKDFVVNEVPGKLLTIKTTNKDDLRVVIRFSGDKINFNAKPTIGPEYEFAYNFDKDDTDNVFHLIKSAFENDPNNGLITISKDTYQSDTDEQSTDIDEDDVQPLDVPITKKPTRRTRSININVIQDVLEDAFILDDIDLRDTSIEELIRRMLLETRRKSKK